MPTHTLQRFLFFAITIVLAACGSVEYADDDTLSSARSFSVSEDVSHIYVFRDDNVVLNTPITVSVDGQIVGVTENKTFTMTSVQPGKHTVTAKAENIDELTVETQGGEAVFVEIGVNLGVVTNRAHLKRVDAERGKAAVMRTRMVD